MIKELSISGFRGFGQTQLIKFSIPDKKQAGSGLTIITGANNSGKTTIIESIRAFIGDASPSFSEGKRNQMTGGKISLRLTDKSGKTYAITSVSGGGSSTEKMNRLILTIMFCLPEEQFRLTLAKAHGIGRPIYRNLKNSIINEALL